MFQFLRALKIFDVQFLRCGVLYDFKHNNAIEVTYADGLYSVYHGEWLKDSQVRLQLLTSSIDGTLSCVWNVLAMLNS